MADRVIIEVEEENLDPNLLREKLVITGSGAIVSFTGLTRINEDGIEVHALEFDAWIDRLPIVLDEIANIAIDKFGIESVAMSHRVGHVRPEEPIVSIHVASKHRKEAFQACSWLIDTLKAQAPLWKKEIREDGTHWKEGLG